MIKCGIDIGGTNIKVGFFNESELFYTFQFKTPKKREEVLPTLVKEIKSKRNSEQIEKYVICIPGVVKDNVVIFAPNLNIVGINLYDELSKAFKCNNILVENDANLAALAESKASGCDNLCLITLGTGVGAGIIINGKILNLNGFTGEIGHLKVEFGPKARRCTCGRYGCAEMYVSAKNMPIEYNKNHHTRLNSKEIFDLYEQGDKDAIKCVEHFARYLGILISNCNQVLGINEFRIGGGLSLACDQFIDLVYKYYKLNSVDGLMSCNISKAYLENKAGIYAAIYL